MANQITIAQLVAAELPAGFVVSSDYIATQAIIQETLYYQAAGLPSTAIGDETQWSQLWVILIGYLIVIEIIKIALTGGILAIGGSTSSSASGGAGVKKITTGPTEVEWQDTAAAFATLTKNFTTSPDSLFGLFLNNACNLSRQLGVKIPLCKGVQLPFQLLKASECYGALLVPTGAYWWQFAPYSLDDYLGVLYASIRPVSMGGL